MKRTFSTAFHQPNNNTDIPGVDEDEDEYTDNDPTPKRAAPTMHVRDANPDPIAPVGPSSATPIQALGTTSQMLLVARAQTTESQQASESTQQMAIQAADVNLADENGQTRLMLAAQEGDLPTVQALLSHGANVNLADNKGWTALMLAAKKGHLAVAQALLGASEIDIEAKNDDEETALLLAALNGHCDLVKALIKKGANVNVADYEGWTTLMYATNNGYLTTVQALLGVPGIDIDAKKDGRVTALYLAAMNGHCDLVKALLEHGADIKSTFEKINTELHNLTDGSDESSIAILQLLMNYLAQRQANVGNLNEEATWASACATSAIPPKASEEVIPSPESLTLETLLQQAQVEVPSLLQISFQANRDQLLQLKLSATQVANLIYMLHNSLFSSALVQTLAVAIKLGGHHTKSDQNFIYEQLNSFRLFDVFKKSQSCLDSGNINRWQTSGQTLLTRAAQAGDLLLIDALINCGAAIYLPDQHGNNALHAAVKAGKWSVCSHLLALDANPNTSDRSGVSTLTYLAQAFARGDEQTAAFVASLLGPLLAKGHRLDRVVNDPDDLEEGTETTILEILRSDLNRYVLYADLLHADGVNHTDNNGWTALMIAAKWGHLTTVQALLGTPGIDLEIKDTYGLNALMFATANHRGDVVKALIEHGANVNVRTTGGWTLLMSAAEQGDLTTIQALLSAPGININAQKDDGATAFIVAAANGKDDVVKVLINGGANVNVASNNRWTPLMGAAQKGDLTTIQALLSVPGININAQNSEGSTALLVAALNGNYDVVKALIKQGADVDITDNHGQTPMMVASSLGYLTIVQAFFDRY